MFKIYPNPIVNNNFYIFSPICNNNQYYLSLYDLHGRVIQQTRFKPKVGVQFILERPKNIIPGEYILKIEGKDFSQVEKIIFE